MSHQSKIQALGKNTIQLIVKNQKINLKRERLNDLFYHSVKIQKALLLTLKKVEKTFN